MYLFFPLDHKSTVVPKKYFNSFWFVKSQERQKEKKLEGHFPREIVNYNDSFENISTYFDS